MCALPAVAQTDVIGLYSDQSYNDCTLSDGSARMVSVYVVHESSMGGMASQFRLSAGSGANLSYVGETTPYTIVVGNTQSGITVGYGTCQRGDVLVVTVNYFASGTSSACSYIRVVPDPISANGTIEIVDCSFYASEGIGSKLVINPDGTCECGLSSEETSWGRIKAQYD